MTIKMLRILMWCLVASFIQAAAGEEQCQIGNNTFTGLDINKAIGRWYELYRIQTFWEDIYANCEYFEVFETENGIGARSVVYNTIIRAFQTYDGTVPRWTNNSFYISYYNFGFLTWVVGTDYETYCIMRFCLPFDNNNPLTWVLSPGTEIDDETKKKVNSILEQFDLNLDNFQQVSQVDCVKYKNP